MSILKVIKANILTKLRYRFELKGTVLLGLAMKVNRKALEDGMMSRADYEETRKIYKDELEKLLNQEMPL